MRQLLSSKLDRAFRITLYIKAIDGVVELIIGLLLLVLTPSQLNRPIEVLTNHALDHDIDDSWYRSIAHYYHHLSGGALRFAAIYLIADAVVKLIVINEVLHKRYWAYIALIVILSGLVVYQSYRIVLYHSVLLTGLTLFDVLIIYLSARDYGRRRIKKTLIVPDNQPTK